MEEKVIIEELVHLIEAWMDGIMARIGIRWDVPPPALTKARQWLDNK